MSHSDKGERLVLGFKLIRQDEICVLQQALVSGHDILVDVDPSIVAHDGIEY